MIEKLLQKAREKNIDLEIYQSQNAGSHIIASNDKLSKFEVFNNTNYKIKALINGKMVSIYTGSIDNPDMIIEELKNSAIVLDNDDKDEFAQQFEFEQVDVIDNEDDDKNANDLLNLVKFKDKYPNIITIDSYYDKKISKTTIYNTNNVKLEDINKMVDVYVEIVIKENGINQSVSLSFYDKDFDINNINKQMDDKIEKTIKKAYAKSCQSKKYNIILKNEVVADILNTFNNMFFAEAIRKKYSVLTDKLNKKVFSDKITIVEDPLDIDFPERKTFDSEGVKTSFKEIVKDGVFVRKLYDNKTAFRENTKSTGNSLGVINRYIKPGSVSFKKLVNELNNGIIIDYALGLHSGINTATGDISIQAEGFAVENGTITTALNQIVLSTNIFELLTNVEAVGSDLKKTGSNGGAPSLLINDVFIAGKE